MDTIRRKGSTAVAIAAAAAGLGWTAAPALAGTVALETATMSAPKSPSWEAGFTTWRAAPGEANRLSVTFDGDTIVLRDAGAPLAAGRGCRALADGAVACTPTRGVAGNQFAGEAGDGDDTVALQAPDSGYATVRLGEGDDRVETQGAGLVAHGGAGADVLIGGVENDTLTGDDGSDELRGGEGEDLLDGDGRDGRPAADLLDGGPGARDRVSYRERSEGVEVDLAAGTGGAPGEGDRLVGVEDVEGGAGADVLRGDDAANELEGGQTWAADVIEGRGGEDRLSGYGPRRAEAGVLRLVGGDGDDVLYADDHADFDGGAGDDYLWGDSLGSSRCGPGQDRIEPSAGTLVARDCETIETQWFELTRLRPGAERLGVTLRATGQQHPGTCGAELSLRADGRTLARRVVRLRGKRERRLQLAPRPALPAIGRLIVGYASCEPDERPVGAYKRRQGVHVALR